MNNEVEKNKISKTIKEAKERIKKIKPEKVIDNTQKAKARRGY